MLNCQFLARFDKDFQTAGRYWQKRRTSQALLFVRQNAGMSEQTNKSTFGGAKPFALPVWNNANNGKFGKAELRMHFRLLVITTCRRNGQLGKKLFFGMHFGQIAFSVITKRFMITSKMRKNALVALWA